MACSTVRSEPPLDAEQGPDDRRVARGKKASWGQRSEVSKVYEVGGTAHVGLDVPHRAFCNVDIAKSSLGSELGFRLGIPPPTSPPLAETAHGDRAGGGPQADHPQDHGPGPHQLVRARQAPRGVQVGGWWRAEGALFVLQHREQDGNIAIRIIINYCHNKI